MYKLPYYIEHDKETVVDFMRKNAFVVIVANGTNVPSATHIPVNITVNAEGSILLSGHIMKNTDHHKAFEEQEQVLVIFNGPHCFVSAGWYTDPASGSTWDYMTVHARGKIRFTDDAGTLALVKQVSDTYEGSHSIAAFDVLSQSYKDQMVKAIVGFVIEVAHWDAVFKLSQNRDLASQKNIVSQLRKRGDEPSIAIANEIEKRWKAE